MKIAHGTAAIVAFLFSSLGDVVRAAETPPCTKAGVLDAALAPMPKRDERFGFYWLNGERLYLRGNYTLAAGCKLANGCEFRRVRTVFDCYQTRQGAPIGYCYHEGDPTYKGYQRDDVVDEDYYSCPPGSEAREARLPCSLLPSLPKWHAEQERATCIK